MDIEQITVFLIIGLVSGWLAGVLFKGGGFGVVGNMIVGILGAVLGAWIFDLLDVSIGGRWLGPIVTATVGALVLLFLISLVRKKK